MTRMSVRFVFTCSHMEWVTYQQLQFHWTGLLFLMFIRLLKQMLLPLHCFLAAAIHAPHPPSLNSIKKPTFNIYIDIFQ